MTSYLVSVYKNNKGTIMFIPNKTKIGISFHVNKVYTVSPPYDASKVGEVLKECFAFCGKLTVDYPEINYKEVVKGYKSFRQFSKEWVLANALMFPNKEYMFKSNKRDKEGGHSFNGEEPIILPISSDSEALGQALLEALNKSV
jgi:hypothetical protein